MSRNRVDAKWCGNGNKQTGQQANRLSTTSPTCLRVIIRIFSNEPVYYLSIRYTSISLISLVLLGLATVGEQFKSSLDSLKRFRNLFCLGKPDNEHKEHYDSKYVGQHVRTRSANGRPAGTRQIHDPSNNVRDECNNNGKQHAIKTKARKHACELYRNKENITEHTYKRKLTLPFQQEDYDCR